MFGSASSSFVRRAYSLLALVLVAFGAACDSSDPVGFQSDTVVLEGQVASLSTASSAPAAASGISLLGGIEVSVEGGTATTFTDDSGHFRLEVEAEEASTIVLRFRRALLDVLIEIDGVTAGATIRFAVSLTAEGGTVIHRDDDDNDDDEDFEGRAAFVALTGEEPSRTLRVALVSSTRTFDVDIVEGVTVFDGEGDVLGLAALLIALDRTDLTVRMEGDGDVQDGGATLATFVKVETDAQADGTGGEGSSGDGSADDGASGDDSSGHDDAMGEAEFRGSAVLVSSIGAAPTRTVRVKVTGELHGDAQVWLVDLVEGETSFDASGDFFSVGSVLSAFASYGVVDRLEGTGTMGAEAIVAATARAERD